MIKIRFNGEDIQVPENLTLRGLAGYFQLPAERIAIEHNREIVKRKDWPLVAVKEGDQVEVVHFVGGG